MLLADVIAKDVMAVLPSDRCYRVTMVKVADVNHLTLEVIDCFVTDGSHICWQMLLPYICKDRCYCPIVIG